MKAAHYPKLRKKVKKW